MWRQCLSWREMEKTGGRFRSQVESKFAEIEMRSFFGRSEMLQRELNATRRKNFRMTLIWRTVLVAYVSRNWGAYSASERLTGLAREGKLVMMGQCSTASG